MPNLGSPLLLVQVNRFQCGGIAIGACISHRVVDASVLGTHGDCEAVASHFELANCDRGIMFNASDIAMLRDKGNINEMVSAFIWKRFMESKNRSKFAYSAFHSMSLRKRRAPPLAEQGFRDMVIVVSAVLIAAENDDKTTTTTAP
ncbi:hypothetical protein Sjap_016396 [Stephania japonica]|uniref:Uncharacterized protein n=1 Tax=Stephania japonica TaxID=461633 RepID=A0AAP0IKY5_9MAGN